MEPPPPVATRKPSALFNSASFHSKLFNMASVEEQQDIRAKFYNSSAVVKHIKANGIPKSDRAFRDMITSGTSEALDSKEGLDLMACLGEVVFRSHAQQINIVDKSKGKTIVSIPR